MEDWHVNKDTKLFFSVSSKPGNFGASLFNAGFRELGIDAIYKPIGLNKEQNFAGLLLALQTIGASGLSVSMPFKKMAYKFSYDIFEDKIQVNNRNTLTFVNHKIFGTNTDCTGFSTACENILENSKTAVIFGEGAVSDSIAYVLNRNCIQFKKVNSKNVYLLREGGDFLINATPIGMQGIEDNVFTEDIVRQYRYVFDVVVGEKPTNLMKLADEFCYSHISGATMSFYQLCRQFSIYTEQVAPVDLFSKILKERYYVQI